MKSVDIAQTHGGTCVARSMDLVVRWYGIEAGRFGVLGVQPFYVQQYIGPTNCALECSEWFAGRTFARVLLLILAKIDWATHVLLRLVDGACRSIAMSFFVFGSTLLFPGDAVKHQNVDGRSSTFLLSGQASGAGLSTPVHLPE